MGGGRRRSRERGSGSDGSTGAEEERYIARCRALGQAPDPSVLTTLATDWWFLSPSIPFGGGGCLALVEVLARSRTITHLTLRCDPRRGARGCVAADARALASAISRNSSLREVDCSRCGLDDRAVGELAAALGRSTSIVAVRLEGNAFGDDGCAALASHLGADGCSVRELDVSNNGLYFTGIRRLQGAVRKHDTSVLAVGNYTTEEILNTVTHGVGFFLALVASIPLLSDAWPADRATFWACAVYQFTLLTCFGASTGYHGFFNNPSWMEKFQRLDHAAIYLLIAGSYTPLLGLGCRGRPAAALIVVLNWCAAFGGCIVSAAGIGISSVKLNYAEIATYAAMGFAVVPVAPAARSDLGDEAFFLLALGGAFYLAGIVFFVRGMRHPGWHVVWHLFVMAGAATHWFCVYLYVLPGAAALADSSGPGRANDGYGDDLRAAVAELRETVATYQRYHAADALRDNAWLATLVNESNATRALLADRARAAWSHLPKAPKTPALPSFSGDDSFLAALAALARASLPGKDKGDGDL